MTYKIVRYFAPGAGKKDRVIKRGLTLEAAQAHCSDPKTKKDGVYFDGYREEQ